MQPRRDQGALVLELDGDSMRPGLPRGCRLRVEPLPPGAEPAPGEIVALRGPAGFVVHRLVLWAGTRLVHRGDASGRLGVAATAACCGRVSALLHPDLPLPTLARLAPAARRAFRRAQLRACLFLWLASMAERLRVPGRPLGRLAALLRGLLLKA